MSWTQYARSAGVALVGPALGLAGLPAVGSFAPPPQWLPIRPTVMISAKRSDVRMPAQYREFLLRAIGRAIRCPRRLPWRHASTSISVHVTFLSARTGLA